MIKPLKIVFVASEVEGFSKSGGLADVARALPLHLKAMGHDIRIVTPFYQSIAEEHQTESAVELLGVPMGTEEMWCAVRQTELQGTVSGKNISVPVYFVEHEHYFNRTGYYDDGQHEYPDNALRFGFFSKSVLQLCRSLKWYPDILHANDWHTALAPFYLKQDQNINSEFQNCRSVLTIHNAGYLGIAPGNFRSALGISYEDFHSGTFEDHGQLNSLKGGIAFADRVNTVSPGYADELRTPLGSHGLFTAYQNKGDRFSGILNGCDYDEWNPETDEHLPATYKSGQMKGKAVCRKKLQEYYDLPVLDDLPVIGIVSRLVWQKGFEYLVPALTKILRWRVQLVVLGSGEAWIANSFDQLKEKHPDQLGWKNGYDNALAHLIEAGSDLFLMPSLYEPCGLNQLYSLRYGTLPIVRNIGGLKNTVIQYDESVGEGSGFIFDDPTPNAVTNTVGWAVSTYYDRPEHFRKMIAFSMQQRFTWNNAAEEYVALYQETFK